MIAPEAQEVYNRLSPKLKHIAAKVANTDPETDRDDIFQQMAVVFWERAASSPDFIHQKDAYILVACAHNGGTNTVRKQRTYRRYNVQMTERDSDAEDGEAPSFSPEPSDPAPTPEQQVETNEFWAALAAAVRQLAPVDQVIVKMLYLGDRPVDIAAALGVHRSTISRRQAIIRQNVAALL